jgi:hypothetical protein
VLFTSIADCATIAATIAAIQIASGHDSSRRLGGSSVTAAPIPMATPIRASPDAV